MIRNIVFDFGGVLIDWNPLHLYNGYFGNEEKARWFIDHICTMPWNTEMDAGKSFSENIAELIQQHPEWLEAITIFDTRWKEMVSGPIEGMYEVICSLKKAGYHVFGLSNWNWDKFISIRDEYPAISALEGYVISGKEHVIKPDPRIYEILLNRYHLDPAETLFTDDNPDNLEGARRVGMQALPFTGTAQFVADLEKLLGCRLEK